MDSGDEAWETRRNGKDPLLANLVEVHHCREYWVRCNRSAPTDSLRVPVDATAVTIVQVIDVDFGSGNDIIVGNHDASHQCV